MLLEIKKLSVRVKSSGLKAVDGIDLSVNAGEPLLILGQKEKIFCRQMQRNEGNFTEAISRLSLKIR